MRRTRPGSDCSNFGKRDRAESIRATIVQKERMKKHGEKVFVILFPHLLWLVLSASPWLPRLCLACSSSFPVFFFFFFLAKNRSKGLEVRSSRLLAFLWTQGNENLFTSFCLWRRGEKLCGYHLCSSSVYSCLGIKFSF